MGDTNLTRPPYSAMWQAWQARRKWHIWPRAGGWEAQPLNMLIQMDTLDLVYETMTFLNSKDADWSRATRLQLDLKTWLEKA